MCRSRSLRPDVIVSLGRGLENQSSWRLFCVVAWVTSSPRAHGASNRFVSFMFANFFPLRIQELALTQSSYFTAYERFKQRLDTLVSPQISPPLSGTSLAGLYLSCLIRNNLTLHLTRARCEDTHCDCELSAWIAADQYSISCQNRVCEWWYKLLNRMQPHLISGSIYIYSALVPMLRDMVRQRGWLGLWRGLGPTLVRDAPFSVIYWTGFEGIREYIVRKRKWKEGFFVNFLAGLSAGLVAAATTTPIDVIKTRQQMHHFGEVTYP